MVRTTSTLLKGWPSTTVITGKKNQFLGYRVECRYFSPLGRKLLKPLSVALWIGAFVAGVGLAGDVPEDEALGAMLTGAALIGGIGQCLLVALLRSRLEMEIRPQVIRWHRRLRGKVDFDTRACGFAIFRHGRAQVEEAKEHQRYFELQQGENVEMPGRWFRNSASVALIVMAQRVDIAHVYDSKGDAQGPRQAVNLYLRLAALLDDVRARGWGS